jgi:hypothetical protein
MKEELRKLANELESIFTIVHEVNTFNTFGPWSKASSDNPLRKAFEDFLEEFGDKDFALMGGLALNTYLKRPRATQDVDLLFKSDHAITPEEFRSEKFKRHRYHALEHKDTGVEIELLTPEFLNIDSSKASQMIGRSRNRILQPEDILDLKVEAGRLKDLGDATQLIRDNPKLLKDLADLPESKGKERVLEELEDETLEERDKS